ncbi:hypothetical protein BDW42DRAFT_201246 [Aspergillus taichungensis]|uniref:Uncharacterized protein n=1 Tax=Aspergillus taichungensis TaxID=482145 RepID=A0A2J5HTD9_9EURO|nr:hypothetical protein BDW42DRAFT_201246 [Aspergillus taichungensis]
MTVEVGNQVSPMSVKEIWETTIVRFQERTGQRLDGVSQRPDDLRRLLDAHYAAQADGKGVAKAKATGFQMIHCIQLLGGIAAQGASMAFAPAGLCFNALSFLLDIPKKVHEFHGEIDAIFAEVGPALAQFRIYERMEDSSRLDEALLMSIYQVMTSFVNLCADCINIHHEGRWKGFKRNAKRILLDDGSVQGQLANFKKLTQDQLNVQATLTLEAAVETGLHVKFIKATTLEIDINTKAIKGDVSGLVEAENKRTLDGNRTRILSMIKTKLGLQDDTAAVIEARERMWKGAVKDSGKWLNEIDAYKQWVDSSSAAEPLLVLTGAPGTGKSFLISAIAEDIKSGNLPMKAERSLIGYYPFANSEKGGIDGDRQRPEAAIKSICAQLAEQDLAYGRRVSTMCSEPGKNEKYFRDTSCTDLWATLGIGMPGTNTTHYILLDSVSTLSAEDRERLMRAIQEGKQDGSNRVRVLISCEPGAFKRDQLLSSRTKTINITTYNEADVKAFIMEELKRERLFQGTDEDSQRRKRMVEERLLARSDNIYSTIQQDMRKVKDIVESGGTEEELSRILNESITDPQHQVRLDIETMETTLKPREIEEINELLIWAVAADQDMLLSELEAALFLRFNAVSLQPLEEKIMGKYSRLFSLVSATSSEKAVVLKDHVRDCVVVQRDRPRESEDNPKITATISITNADHRLVQRFFWDLNHHSFLGGFAFQPAADMANVGQRRIKVNEVDAHLEIIKRAFNLFQQPVVDKRGKVLGEYLMSSIPLHLKALSEVTGFDELQPADKQFIGSSVYDLFNDENIIERNWEFCSMWAIWFSSSDQMDVRLGPRDKRWLQDLKRDKHRNSNLLVPIMTMIARNWLQKTEWTDTGPFLWIRGYLTLEAEPPRDEEDGTTEEDKDLDEGDGRIVINPRDPPLKCIARCEQWCKQALGVSEVDYTWCMRLGDTYAQCRDETAASENYKKPNSKEDQKAATIVQLQNPVNKEHLREAFKALSRCATDPVISFQYLKEASKLDEDNVEVLLAMLRQYVASGQENDARSIIQKAVTNKVSGTTSNQLVAMLKTTAMSVIQEMESAIDTARTEAKTEEVAILLLQLGRARYYIYRNSAEQSAISARHLHDCLDIIKDDTPLEDRKLRYFIELPAAVHLSMFYFDRCIEPDRGNLEANVELLRQIHEDHPVFDALKSILAALYSFKRQRDKAHDIFRSEMVEVFNMLADDISFNDVDAFMLLRNILDRSGDYENALRAALLFPKYQFDETVIKGLLAEQGSAVAAVGAELVQFYQANGLHKKLPWERLVEVQMELSRLAAQADAAREEQTACFEKIEFILNDHERRNEWGIVCTNCNRCWDYDLGLHACKYCYNVDLCDACWDEMKSGKTATSLVCSSTHEWYDLPPLTEEQYFRACKEQVLIRNDGGEEELVSVSKWLGTLCEEWGLSKADWNFEC